MASIKEAQLGCGDREMGQSPLRNQRKKAPLGVPQITDKESKTNVLGSFVVFTR